MNTRQHTRALLLAGASTVLFIMLIIAGPFSATAIAAEDKGSVGLEGRISAEPP